MTAATPGPQTPPAGWAPPPEAPAGPAQGLRYAGLWVRFVAFILNAIGLLLDLIYFVGFWTWRGQSPGIPFNMRIVLAADGGKVDVVRALLRYVGLIISIVVLFLGVIWVAFHRRKQGWHDKIAGTVVVRPT